MPPKFYIPTPPELEPYIQAAFQKHYELAVEGVRENSRLHVLEVDARTFDNLRLAGSTLCGLRLVRRPCVIVTKTERHSWSPWNSVTTSTTTTTTLL